MRRLLTALLVIAVVTGLAEGAPAIYLQASQAKTSVKKRNQWGDTDKIQHQAINITARNMRNAPETFTIQWLFIAQSEQDKKLWTYSYDASTIILKGGQTTNMTVTSDKLVAKSYDIYFGTHSKPSSYVVVAFQETNIITCVANSRSLQVKCSKWEGFEDILNSTPPEE